MEYIKIIVAILVALVGWVVAHKFTSKRDLDNKKRESILSLTTECYRAISAYMADPGKEEGLLNLTDALIKVQCFGSKEQIDMAKRSLQSIASPRNSVEGLGDLLTSLRNSFRKDLGICKIEGNVAVVRRTKS